MDNKTNRNGSALQSMLKGFGIILMFLMCLFGLMLTAYGFILIKSPPFGPVILGFGLAMLVSAITLLRMLFRRV